MAYAEEKNVLVSGGTRTSDGTSYSAAKITAAAAICLQTALNRTPLELREEIIADVEYHGCRR